MFLGRLRVLLQLLDVRLKSRNFNVFLSNQGLNLMFTIPECFISLKNFAFFGEDGGAMRFDLG
jgi:hypothetical protein